jgi:hypothetical protein
MEMGLHPLNDETHIPAMIDRQKAFLYHEQYPTNHEHCDQKGKSLDKAAFGVYHAMC